MTLTSKNDDADMHSDALLHASVIDASGNHAFIVSIDRSEHGAQAWVHLGEGEAGTRVRVPLELLQQDDDGVYRLPFSFDVSTHDGPMQMRIPVMEEEAHIDKRVIDTGKGVRVHKTVSEKEQLLDTPLLHDELTVEHVAVGRMLSDNEMPQTRYEGDTLIVPVLEEVLVVQKQVLLKEEVHITRRQREVHEPQRIVLRAEQVSVERFDEGRQH